MATVAYKLPTTAKDGGSSWSTITDLFVKAESPVVKGAKWSNFTTMNNFVDRSVKLVLADTPSGNDKATDLVCASDSKVYGGTADTWGLTLTGADVSNPLFGVVYKASEKTGGGSIVATSSELYAQGFGFSLPDTAVINGVQVRTTNSIQSGGGGTQFLYIDTIEVQLTYTYDQRVYVTGFVSAMVHSTQANPQAQVRDKVYRYQVFDTAGNFVGEWSDVASEPKIKRDINNLLTNMDVELGRTEQQTQQAVDDLHTESGPAELITDEADAGILAEIIASLGLGPGSNVELNYNLIVTAYFGYDVELTTEADELLTTEADETFLVQEGYPDGKIIYQGYLSRWIAQFGLGSENVQLSSIAHSNELKNIMFTTDDTAIVQGPGWDGYTTDGFSGGGPTDNDAIGQSWTQVGNVPVSRVAVKARAWGSVPVIVTGRIVQGTPDAVVATISTFSIEVYNQTMAYVSAALDVPTTLANGTVYSIIFDGCNMAKTGGNVTYPFTVALGTGYSGGQAYSMPGGVWGATYGGGYDMDFVVYQPGGNTKVTLAGLTPGQIIRRAIDQARQKGSRVRYEPWTIDADSAIITSITFNANTIDEVIDLARKAAPANYYTFFDPSTNLVYYKQRATTAQRFFTLGNDIVSLKLQRTIEQIINEVYFTGGGNPALFDKTVDTGSQTSWRPGISKMSDNRVTQLADSTLLSQNQIDTYKNPVYIGDLVIAAAKYIYPIEDVQPGEMWGLTNFGNFIDQLLLQASSITYQPDQLSGSLGTLLPITDERLEQLRRDLEVKALENNPSSPS